MTVTFTEQQAQNLLTFLGRVDLKGNEALILAQLQQIIRQAMLVPLETVSVSEDGHEPESDGD